MIPFLAVLVPAVIAFAMLRRETAPKVFLRVYLPCIMLIPTYLSLQLAGLSLSSSSLVIALLAAAGLLKEFRSLKISLLDICIVLSLWSTFYADAHLGSARLGEYAALSFLFTSVFPYIVGRTLMVQGGIRTAFAKQFVLWLCFIALVSLWEFATVTNQFQNRVEMITHVWTGWIRQTRWGFCRVAGPYGHAIIAGMMFTTGLMLQTWLWVTKRWDSLGPFKSKRIALIVTSIVLLGLLITLSRGPWIGCALGLIVASVGLFQNRKRALILSSTVLIVSVSILSIGVDQYTAPAATANRSHMARSQDLDQENAVYRRQLIQTYWPMVQEGGLWGWGSPHNGVFGILSASRKQPSIDNDYLLIGVSQGYFGAGIFILMLCLSCGRLVYYGLHFSKRENFTFAFCLLGIIVAAGFTLTTVFLGQPTAQFLFIALGWSQSIELTEPKSSVAKSAEVYVFERVFV